MSQKTVEDIFEQLINIQKTTNNAFIRLENDVRELKDARYKPYFASAAAFLAIVISVMGYVYSLETRLTQLLFKLNAQVSVSDERLNVLDSRLKQRTESIHVRWQTHNDVHQDIRQSLRTIATEILEDRRKYIDKAAQPADKSEDSGD